MAIKDIKELYKQRLAEKGFVLPFDGLGEPSKEPTKFISDDDMHQTIRTIISCLPDGIEGYNLASQLYGSDFFAGESPAFKAALGTALNTKFAGYKNFYWLKLVNENASI
jgi:hypothetical protein